LWVILWDYLFTLTLLFPSNSLAAKPHFSETPHIVKNSDLSITINYGAKEIGKKSANVTLSSHTTALIGCINPGGKKWSDSTFIEISSADVACWIGYMSQPELDYRYSVAYL
jgi:hypothetical protein